MQPIDKQAYSVKDVAGILGVSRWTVTRLFERERGVLNLGTDSNRVLRIPRHVLERVVRKRSIQ